MTRTSGMAGVFIPPYFGLHTKATKFSIIEHGPTAVCVRERGGLTMFSCSVVRHSN